MHRKRAVDVRVFEHAFGNCFVGTVVAFLTGLEEQLHRAFQFAFVRFQNTGGAKQGGRVHVMAAGMHVAVGRCEFLARFFSHRQTVDVASQHKARLALSDGSDNARSVDDRVEGNAELGELRLDIRARIGRFKPDFRHLVDVAAPCDKLLFERGRLFEEIDGCRHWCLAFRLGRSLGQAEVLKSSASDSTRFHGKCLKKIQLKGKRVENFS